MRKTVHPQFKTIHQHKNQYSSEEDNRIQSLYQQYPWYLRKKKKKNMQSCTKVKLTSKKHMKMNPDMTQMFGWCRKNLKAAIIRVYVLKEKMVLMSEWWWKEPTHISGTEEYMIWSEKFTA